MTVSAAPGGLAGAPAAVGMPSLMAAQGLGRAVSGGDRRAAGRGQIIFSFERRWASSKGLFVNGDNGHAPRLQHHCHHLVATTTHCRSLLDMYGSRNVYLVVRSSIPYAAAFRPFGIIAKCEFVFNRLQFESC